MHGEKVRLQKSIRRGLLREEAIYRALYGPLPFLSWVRSPLRTTLVFIQRKKAVRELSLLNDGLLEDAGLSRLAGRAGYKRKVMKPSRPKGFE